MTPNERKTRLDEVQKMCKVLEAAVARVPGNDGWEVVGLVLAAQIARVKELRSQS